MFQKIVVVCFVLVSTLFATTASADEVEKTCPATGTIMSSSSCLKETQKQLNVCVAKDDCTKASKPVPAITCAENPGNAGKIRRTGKWSCTCDDPGFRVALANYGSQRCFVITESLLVDELARLRDLLSKGVVSRSEFDALKEKVMGLGGQSFASKAEFDAEIGKIDGRLAKVEGRVTALETKVEGLDGRVTKLEKASPSAHAPFSVVPELGMLVAMRPVSGAHIAPELGLRMKYNAAQSPWYFSVGGAVAYGTSQGNGASYVYQGKLAIGRYLDEARKVSLDAGPYAHVFTADMAANPSKGVTTNGRGHSIGGFAGFSWQFAAGFTVRLEGGLGSGKDNVVHLSTSANGMYFSKSETGLQPYGGVFLGYELQF